MSDLGAREVGQLGGSVRGKGEHEGDRAATGRMEGMERVTWAGSGGADEMKPHPEEPVGPSRGSCSPPCSFWGVHDLNPSMGDVIRLAKDEYGHDRKMDLKKVRVETGSDLLLQLLLCPE